MDQNESMVGTHAGGAADAPPVFVLRGVRQRKRGAEVLQGVDLEVLPGTVTALVGPSGAGKTSLLRLLNRLDDPVAGEISFHGRPLASYPVRELRCGVGFAFQTPVMFPGTVRANLLEAAALTGRPGDEASVRRALELAELDPSLLEREGDSLSVGQKQRANLARALMTDPRVLLMDEPTSALDPETADRLTDTVRHLSEAAGLTIVMVTHRLREARRGSHFTVMLEAGRVVQAGPTPEMFGPGALPRVRKFLETGG